MALSFNGKEVNKICFNNNVGYEKVGNPTIVDGVVSGFSNVDYLDIGNFLWDNIHSIENGVKFTTASTFLSQSIMGRAPGASPRDTGVFFRQATPGITAKYRISYDNGNSWQVIELQSSFTSIVSNHTYYVNWSISTITNKMIVRFSEDGQNWITDELSFEPGAILENLTNQKIGRTGNHGAFVGSIDLNETYIKVNGVNWFSGKQQASPIVNEVYLNRNVGYTVVGSPTINDGVVSGFSQSSYCYISNTVNNLQITECICKINIPSSVLGKNTYYQIFFGVLSITTYSDASAFTQATFYLQGIGNLFINHNLQPDTDYWIKYTNDGTNCTAWWSEDGINYTAGQSKPQSSMISQTTNTVIGLRGSAGQINGDRVFPGSIDLNETYIKVNGVTWFNGKQTATTPVWTRSV